MLCHPLCSPTFVYCIGLSWTTVLSFPCSNYTVQIGQGWIAKWKGRIEIQYLILIFFSLKFCRIFLTSEPGNVPVLYFLLSIFSPHIHLL